MNLLILNRCYSSNYGDQAIGKYCEGLFLNCNIDVTTKDISSASINTRKINIDKEIIKSNFLKKYAIWKYLRNIKNIFSNRKMFSLLKVKKFDCVVIGGGELIKSNGFIINIFLWIYLIKKHNPKISIYFLGIGVEKNFDFLEKLLIKYILKMTNKAWVRDIGSQNNIFKVSKKIVGISPDIVFFDNVHYEYNSTNTILYSLTDINRIISHTGNKISREGYYKSQFEIIRKIRETGKNVILIYMNAEDFYETQRFYSYETVKNICELADYSNFDELLSYIKGCDELYSPRMHACILGLKYKKIVHPIVISNKMKNFNERYLKNNLDLNNLSVELVKIRNEILSDIEMGDNNA